MSRISMVMSPPLALLRFSIRVRLGLVGGSLVLILGLLWVLFPAPTLDFCLLLPLTLASWLFCWRGGFLCLGFLIGVMATHYELAFGNAFWSTTPGMFLLTRILAGLLVCLIVAGLRQMTDTLLETQHAFQQAHLLNEIKDQVLYSLGHELRTPLTQVLGYLDLLEDYHDHLDAATQTQYIASARSGCEEVLDLILTVLETARAPRNDRALPLQTFVLRHEVQTVLAHLAPQVLEEHPVTLALPHALQVHAEPRFVRQIVRNLLTNAFKYTPPHTPIQVKAVLLATSTDGPPQHTASLCVQVIDAGDGISLAQQALLFQPFVRLPNASTKNIPGTGLGLAICKQLVEAMGGRIWVESSGLQGEGCCFSFTLACENVSEMPTSPQTPLLHQEQEKQAH